MMTNFEDIFIINNAYKLSLLDDTIYCKIIDDVYHDSFLAVVVSIKYNSIDTRVISSIYYTLDRSMITRITIKEFNKQVDLMIDKIKSL